MGAALMTQAEDGRNDSETDAALRRAAEAQEDTAPDN
jgi:hypothetical protein